MGRVRKARNRPAHSLLLVAALGILPGCTLIKGTLTLPDTAVQTLLPFTQPTAPPDPVEVQSQLIRFADHYLEAVTRNMRKIQYRGEPISRRELVRRRINYTNEVLAIATGSNAFGNLLDMIVLVTLTRMRVERYLAPQTKGLDWGPIVKVFQQSERDIWRISSAALAPDQQQELRTALATWVQQNPESWSSPDMSDLDFVTEVKRFSRARASSAPASVFNLLMIDPLSGLDPAAKELAETRLMAERALFLSRHLPELIRWETEFLTMNAVDIPQVSKLLSDASRLAESADRFSQATANLPGVIASERARWTSTLKSERQGLTTLAVESKNALAAGRQMADSATATLNAFHAVLAQLAAQPSSPNSEPFRIGDYTTAAAQIGQSSQRLGELLELFNRTLAPDNIEVLSQRLDFLSRRVEARSRGVVDYAFRKTLIASALICAMGLGTVLLYQALQNGLIRRRRPGSGAFPRS